MKSMIILKFEKYPKYLVSKYPNIQTPRSEHRRKQLRDKMIKLQRSDITTEEIQRIHESIFKYDKRSYNLERAQLKTTDPYFSEKVKILDVIYSQDSGLKGGGKASASAAAMDEEIKKGEETEDDSDKDDFQGQGVIIPQDGDVPDDDDDDGGVDDDDEDKADERLATAKVIKKKTEIV
jgi:hypothetical protein